MAENPGRYEELFESIRAGDTRELHAACEKVVRAWKEIPVEPLLALKNQFHKMELEDREAHVDEALISIAEKRPGPFTGIAAEPGHALWRPAVEVLSLLGKPEHLDLFISLLPVCPEKYLQDLVRAIGRYRGKKAVDAIGPFLTADGEGVFFEVVMALKQDGGPEAVSYLKECLTSKRLGRSEVSTVLEAVVTDLEEGGQGVKA